MLLLYKDFNSDNNDNNNRISLSVIAPHPSEFYWGNWILYKDFNRANNDNKRITG